MKKIISFILVTMCFMFGACFSVFGMVGYNAVIVNDGIVYQADWLDNHYTYGAFSEDLKDYDMTSPQSRAYIIKSQNELDDVFAEFPDIDFDKKMVLVYCYTTVYVRKQVLNKVALEGDVLTVQFDVVRGKFGHADAAMPHRRTLAVKLDRVEVAEANVTYKGQ